MENPTVSGLRSRSRSKTPFLRSSCDRENCVEGEEHTHHKSGRKTPVRRSTPVKQVGQSSSKRVSAALPEVEEEQSGPTVRTRLNTRHLDPRHNTSDYSSEESLDTHKGHRKEIFQNEINSEYERVSTSSRRYASLSEVTLSPIHTERSVTHDRSRSRIGSPAYSACSTDSSFAEQALADTSVLLEQDPHCEHLPSRLYKMAREYWNKYPKTDYTYSPLSKDRVELAPGQVAMPNMSRRSLSQFRVQGPVTSADELDRLSAATHWTTSTTTNTLRKRYTSIDSSDDEATYLHKGAYAATDSRWWVTRALQTLATSVSSGVGGAYRKLVGPAHRYPYTDRRPAKASVWRRAGGAAAAPLVWLYVLVTTVITTTVTTITETFTSDKHAAHASHAVHADKLNGGGGLAVVTQRRWWPRLLLLLLLPALGYAWYEYGGGVARSGGDTYAAPLIQPDAALGQRLAALERWARDVDARLRQQHDALAHLDAREQHEERYSVKRLHEDLLRVLDAGDGGAVLASRLRTHLAGDFVSRDDVAAMVDARVSDAAAATDASVHQLLEEHAGVWERRTLELIRERVLEYVREVHTHSHTERVEGGATLDMEAVRQLVASMLDVYDADKTGLVDYALESAGGQVVSTKCTELYQIKTKQYSVLGVPVLWVYTSPRFALTPGNMPAECWAFQGFPGYLVVRTYAIIEVTGFSLEHMSRLLAVDGKIESAPRNFSVYGLHGEMDPAPHLFGSYMYDANGTAIQYFPVQFPRTTDIGGVLYPVAYDMVELRVETNHGNPTYTCVYRFRVHGNPLTDLRTPTDDSIRDSET